MPAASALSLVPNELVVRQILPGPDRITLIARPRSDTALCPLCNRVSRKIHNRYHRTLADLPWHGRAVEIRVEAPAFPLRQPGLLAKYFRGTPRRRRGRVGAPDDEAPRNAATCRVDCRRRGWSTPCAAARHAGQRRNIVANDPGRPGNAASRAARARDRRLGLASRSSLRNHFGRP